MEHWLPIEGYSLYEVSSMGRIRNKNSERILQTSIHPRTKLEMVRLSGPNGPRTFNVHRLVAEHFIGPGEKGFAPNFRNGNRNDNSAENLEWIPLSRLREITADRKLTGPTDRRPVIAVDMDMREFPNALAAARELGGLERWVIRAAGSYGEYSYLRTRWCYKMALDFNPPMPFL